MKNATKYESKGHQSRIHQMYEPSSHKILMTCCLKQYTVINLIKASGLGFENIPRTPLLGQPDPRDIRPRLGPYLKLRLVGKFKSSTNIYINLIKLEPKTVAEQYRKFDLSILFYQNLICNVTSNMKLKAHLVHYVI